MMVSRLFLIPIVTVIVFNPAVYAGIRQITIRSSQPAESLTVWVFFTDKPGAPVSFQHRQFVDGAFSDENFIKLQNLPVSQKNIDEVRLCGGRLRYCYKWENAASFRLPVNSVRKVRMLPCVKELSLMGICRRRFDYAGGKAKRMSVSSSAYGQALNQLKMLRVPQAHRYHQLNGSQTPPGAGVRIAFFDSGFRLDHRCLRHLHRRGAVKAVYDFIDDDTSVADPDSVNDNQGHPYWGNDRHGTEVLCTVTALDTPWYCGVAWGADILLARTEDTFYDQETGLEHELHTEEDSWAAAVVWADSLGTDIISSSLGYRYDFQDTVVITRNDGTIDTVVDYRKSDLDGRTTIISRAAGYAVERGILVVNAAGNEQSDGDTSLSAPADVDGVIAVGAVNSNGVLAYFSSLGPTADGRMKPDLVAPGTSIYLPDVTDPVSIDYNSTNSGTSFAAPLVAGVCALIRQAYPVINASALRDKLFDYCRLLPAQTAPDNAYGYGIPDAARSCMTYENEIFIAVTDTGGVPFAGIEVLKSGGDSIGAASERGIIQLRSEATVGSLVLQAGRFKRMVTVDMLPFFREIGPCSLQVKVLDDRVKPVPYARIRYSTGQYERQIEADSLGWGIVTGFFPEPVKVQCIQTGYQSSDTLHALLADSMTTLTVVLAPIEKPVFDVYPTVLRRSGGADLIIRFAPGDGSGSYNRMVQTAIRSISGSLVWRSSEVIDGGTVVFRWNGNCGGGRNTAPGTYFCMVTCNGKLYRKKIIIAE